MTSSCFCLRGSVRPIAGRRQRGQYCDPNRQRAVAAWNDVRRKAIADERCCRRTTTFGKRNVRGGFSAGRKKAGQCPAFPSQLF